MTNLTPDERSELARVARAATPGPWRHYPSGSYVHASLTKVCQLEDPWIANRNQVNDAIHIAACNPSTVLRLLGQLEASERRRAEVDMVFSCPACGDPGARPVEREVDIHSGAIYTCDQCQARVTFTVEALTPSPEAPTGEEPT